MDIEKLVIYTLTTHLGVPEGEIKTNMTLRGDLLCDSIDDIEILMDLEDSLMIELHTLGRGLSNLNYTVGDLIQNIETLVGEH